MFICRIFKQMLCDSAVSQPATCNSHFTSLHFTTHGNQYNVSSANATRTQAHTQSNAQEPKPNCLVCSKAGAALALSDALARTQSQLQSPSLSPSLSGSRCLSVSQLPALAALASHYMATILKTINK